MTRTIATVLPGHRVIDDGDMLLWRALPTDQRDHLGPFVFIDHYRHQSRRGIGDRPHPHAGIEVLSYLLEGSVEHRDSMGRTDRLGPGDAQHIRAGRGIIHAEQPEGGRHGLQLWTALPPAQKLIEPAYTSFRAAAIPEIVRDGARVCVLAGRVDGVEGPMRLVSPTTWAVVRLVAGASIELAVDADAELGLYVLDGFIEGGEGVIVGPGSLALLTPGDGSVRITATEQQPLDVALLGGAPVEGPILFSGPFVMDTPERLDQARRSCGSGKMGTLDGIPF
jgi:redox-sensitive bicupin YhaK (pirin superfamily)